MKLGLDTDDGKLQGRNNMLLVSAENSNYQAHRRLERTINPGFGCTDGKNTLDMKGWIGASAPSWTLAWKGLYQCTQHPTRF